MSILISGSVHSSCTPPEEKVESPAHTIVDDHDAISLSSIKNSSVSPGAGVKDGEIDFPDGGFRAWCIVFGGVCATFSSFGYVNSWGVFQTYYSDGLLQDVSPSTIAWIGSIQYSLTFALGLIWGRLFDLGYFRISLFISSGLLVLVTFLTGQCTQYWQFFLCQGLTVGLASGCVFGPTLAVVAHWFKRKRSTAYGIVATGSSIGGTIFPIAIQKLLPRIGFPWTMRVMGFILLLSTGMVNLTMKRRLPPSNVQGGLFNIRAFKYAPFTLYTAAAFVCFLGLYTVLTYLDLSATRAGIAPSFDVYFLAIANASSLFGRVLTGILSDKIGCLSVMIPGTLVAGIMTYAWPFARSFGSLLTVSILYGFSSGVFVSLLAVPLIHMGETGDIGRRSGMLFTVLSAAALTGPPISGAIATATGGYNDVGYYAGTCIVVSVVMMWYVRYLVTGHIFKGNF